MALVENHGTTRRSERQMRADKRVKVLVESRATNTTFHGVMLKEGENIITIPESLLDDLKSQVEDADWGPVITRYEKKMHELCCDSNGDKIRDETQVVYNLSQAFVEQYLREPRRFKRVEVLQENIAPKMNERDQMAAAIATELTSKQGRKARTKSASGSTE